MVSKEHRKAFFRDAVSPAAAVVGSAILAWLGMGLVLLGVGVFRVGLDFYML